MTDALKLIVLGLIALIAAYAADQGHDLAFRIHGLIILLVSAGLFVWVLRNSDAPKPVPAAGDYMDGPVRAGVIATAFWGMAGLLVGTYIAFQLAFPALNLEWAQPFANFGRLRPLHTSAVIFAFGGNALLASSIYIVQRTSRTRLFGGNLVWFVFWGYQLFIVLAATGYLLGATQSKEYAEPEWYVDLWLTIVWLAYLVIFLGTIIIRRERHIYVANWFFLAFIITIAMLHVVNNLAIPVSIWGSKSVQLFGGVQDAMTQWWYGHNAVGFFLTAGFLGMMYYYVPKQANRPVYSYKLSIVHFWALIFLYIWAGPHHLHYTALPDWASTLGMVFSVILWMPSWAGMMNGLMTLNGAWDKIRTDPIIRFLVASLAFYGMATFEGPMMSIRAVNSLSHYTDWTVGHVHSGALGWNGMIIFAMIYFLTPRLWNRGAMYSTSAMNWHFWLAMIGIVFYAASMWISGIMEGLMWREVDDQGFLVHSFADTVSAKFPLYVVRGVGGVLYLAGAGIMCWNMWMTIRGYARVSQPVAQMTAPAGETSAPAATPPQLPQNKEAQTMALIDKHVILERSPSLLLAFSLTVVTIGGIVEIAPLFWLENTIEEVEGMRPYSPLELAGRDVYIREGCYVCHSQMIRPMRDEVERYGHYSLAAESMYDHPFQWGSKRTGPDLARVGGRYSDEWHLDHLINPQSVVPESVMPKYGFLLDAYLDGEHIGDLMETHRFVGVPYTEDQIEHAYADFRAQADPESDYDDMLERYPGAVIGNFDGQPQLTEMDALIAYMQMLGTLVDFSTFVPEASR